MSNHDTTRARATLAKIERMYADKPTDANANRLAYARYLADLHGVERWK